MGILSKYPIDKVEGGNLPVPVVHATRKAIACITKVPGIGQVTCFSAHLDDACGGSQDQGEQLMTFANSVAESNPSDLYILGGDFNALPTSDLYSYLTGEIQLD